MALYESTDSNFPIFESDWCFRVRGEPPLRKKDFLRLSLVCKDKFK